MSNEIEKELKLRKIEKSDYDLFPNASPFAMIDDSDEDEKGTIYIVEGKSMEILSGFGGQSDIFDLHYVGDERFLAEQHGSEGQKEFSFVVVG